MRRTPAGMPVSSPRVFWGAIVVGVAALVVAVTVPPGGFVLNDWDVEVQDFWGHVSCDDNHEAIGAFCASGNAPRCSYTLSQPNQWAYMGCATYDGNGGKLLDNPDVVTVPADHVNAFGSVAVCPAGRVVTGICTSGEFQNCLDASGGSVYTSLRCTAVNTGLSIRSYTLAQALAAPDDWTAYAQQSLTIDNLEPSGSIQSNDAGKSTSVICETGYVAVGACSGGSNPTDCSNYVTTELAAARAHLLCVPLPTAGPTPSPTNEPSFVPTDTPTAPGATPEPTVASAAPTLAPTAGPTAVPTTAAPTLTPTGAPTESTTTGAPVLYVPDPTGAPTSPPVANFGRVVTAIAMIIAASLLLAVTLVCWSAKSDLSVARRAPRMHIRSFASDFE